MCDECTEEEVEVGAPCASADGATFTGGSCSFPGFCTVPAVNCTGNNHTRCEECTGLNEGAPCASADNATFTGGLCRGQNTCRVQPVWCGGHYATSCFSCPIGFGRDQKGGDFPNTFCHGQCIWDGGKNKCGPSTGNDIFDPDHPNNLMG